MKDSTGLFVQCNADHQICLSSNSSVNTLWRIENGVFYHIEHRIFLSVHDQMIQGELEPNDGSTFRLCAQPLESILQKKASSGLRL
jgi:hypothetical protein